MQSVWDAASEEEEELQAWRSWLARTGLLKSKANTDRELERLDVSRKELENFQGRLRCYINEVSSPLLRSLHILDVPNEILVKIFEFVDEIEVPVDLFEKLKVWEYMKLFVETS